VIRVYLDVQDVQQVQSAARADVGASHVQAGTSTGTYSDAQIELVRAEQLASALRPLVEAAVAPLRAELADTRAALEIARQELGASLERLRMLEAQREPTPSEIAPGEPSALDTAETSARPSDTSRAWWRFWQRAWRLVGHHSQ
jgi:hypothetical protein